MVISPSPHVVWSAGAASYPHDVLYLAIGREKLEKYGGAAQKLEFEAHVHMGILEIDIYVAIYIYCSFR